MAYSWICLALLCSNLFALPYPNIYRSPQYLGRGNTGIADSGGDYASFYNPAFLTSERGIFQKLTLLSPYLEVSRTVQSTVQKALLQELDPINVLREQIGKVQHIGLGSLTSIALRRVSLALFGKAESTLLLAKDHTARGFEGLKAHSLLDYGWAFSLAESFHKETLALGATIKYLNRSEANLNISATDISALQDLSAILMSGSGYGYDVGCYYRIKGRTNVTFALTYTDIGNLSFALSTPSAIPEADRPLRTIKQALNFGLAIVPGTKHSKMRFLIDFKDILGSSGHNLYKRLHLGTDLSVKNRIGFTAGINQGYPTAGFYLDLFLLRFDIATYGEEFGDNPGSRGDQRYIAQLTMGF